MLLVYVTELFDNSDNVIQMLAFKLLL